MFKKYAYLLTFLWSLDAYAQLSSIQRQEMADINILGPYNPGFENGISKWTASAGTFTAQSATLADGSKTASFVASAGSQTLKSQTVTIPAGLYGSLCTGSVRYKTTSNDNFTLQIIDATPTVLYSRLLHSNSNFEEARLDFACPTSGSLALRLSSSGSGTIYFDNAFLGFIPKARDDQEINLVVTPHDARNWYASGAGVTVATTSTSTDLPLGSVEGPGTAIKITPVSGTSDYARTRVIVPAALASTMLKASWHQRPLSGYASGDLKFDVYSNSASDCSGSFTRLALTTDSSSVTSIPNATGKYTTYFTTDGSSVCYEVRFTRVAGTTALNITNFIFGPGIQPQGAVVSGTTSFTPSFTGVTVNVVKAVYWRSGEYLHGDVEVTASADATTTVVFTPTSSTGISGFTPDTSKLGLRPTIGSGLFLGSTNLYPLALYLDGSEVKFAVDANATALSNTVPSADGGMDSADRLSFKFSYPVAEWAGSGTVNLAQNTPEFCYNSSTSTSANDTSSFAYGPAGAQIQNITALLYRDVTLKYPMQVGDILEVQVSSDRTTWLSVGNRIPNSSAYPLSKFDYTYNAGSYKGIGILPQSSTLMRVYFGEFQASYSSSNVSWATGGGGALYWRVLHAPAGSAVGFGAAATTSSGLVDTTTQSFGGTKSFPNNTYVRATRITSDQSLSTGTVLVFNSEVVDRNGEYDPSTGIFTAQVAGVYLITANIATSNSGGSNRFQLTLITTGYNIQLYDTAGTSSGWGQQAGSVAVNLSAGDTAKLSMYATGTTPKMDTGNSWFTVTKIL